MRALAAMALSASLLAPAAASAQPAPRGGIAGALDKFAAKGFSVRQAFDGTKKEQSPAVLAYVDPTYVIDLGIKHNGWEPCTKAKCANHALVLSPIVEWHRTNTPKRVNTTSGKLSVEYAYGDPTQHAWLPSFNLKAGIKRDELADTNKSSDEYSLNVTAVSIRPGGPNAVNLDRAFHERYLWTPSIGVEVLGDTTVRQPAEVKGVDVTFARARIFLVVYPRNDDGTKPNEASIEFTQRWRTGGQATIGDNHYLAAQFTHYLDKDRRVGVGVGFDDGRDPAMQFLPVDQRWTFGLKVKLGES